MREEHERDLCNGVKRLAGNEPAETPVYCGGGHHGSAVHKRHEEGERNKMLAGQVDGDHGRAARNRGEGGRHSCSQLH